MPGLLSQENRRTFSRGLLDTTQAASNSAASTISAPVDALAWALRKAGVPIPQAPFGGSDWMKAQGLTRDVQSPVANVIGESIGNVLPIVAAAKAPQIAGGLLKVAENASAKAPMNAATRNQAGAIVWHGSPHKFDRFDASKIGTGEGAQAYGHGLYLAESPDVAKAYQVGLSDFDMRVNGLPFNADDMTHQAALDLFGSGGDRWKTVKALQDQAQDLISRGKDWSIKAGKDKMARANWIAAQKELPKYQEQTLGNLYKVDLPDDQIARMLDYDKPIKDQASILEIIRSSLPQDMLSTFDANAKGGISGANAYKNWLWNGGKTEASKAEAMRQAGIPGIRYLDGGSRSAGSGSSNFVVFPGNEGLLNILERNGQPIR